MRNISKKELEDFELMFKEKVQISFKEIFDEIDRFIINTGTLNGENIAFSLKRAILLVNQAKVLGIKIENMRELEVNLEDEK